jgi:NTE family protein
MPADSQNPVVFVFGGGGARAAAAAGAAAVLFEAGIRPSAIVGSSMGFVVGSLIASGMHPEQVCRCFESGEIMSAFVPMSPFLRVAGAPWVLIRHLIGRPPYDGFYNGNKLRKVLNELVGKDNSQIERWPISVAASVFNLLDGRTETITKGEFGHIAAATTAVPGLFRPVELGGGLYLDGGVCDNLPVRTARNLAAGMGCAMVIAINVNDPLDSVDSNHFRGIGSTIFRVMNAHNQVTDLPQESFADVVIRAEVAITLTSKRKEDIRLAIKSGAESAKAALPEIRRRMQARSLVTSSAPALAYL